MGLIERENMKYSKKYLKILKTFNQIDNNNDYISRHPELETFEFPKTFYFRFYPDRMAIHWAIVKPAENFVNVYFINNWGRVFDKLEFKNIKIARRRLRKNGFDFSTNRFCPHLPPEPIYIKLSEGKKSAPYSKGNLWQKVQRNSKQNEKFQKAYVKTESNWLNRRIQCYIDTHNNSQPKIKSSIKQNSEIKEKILNRITLGLTIIILAFLHNCCGI